MGAALLAIISLAGCAASGAPPPAATRAGLTASAQEPTPVAMLATATPTPLPPAEALTRLGRAIDQRTSAADRQNLAIEQRLNAGTTLPPLLPALTAATTANQRAAAAISAMPVPAALTGYRAVQQYQAAEAAGYSTLADAWAALARAANGQGDETLYQSLAALATTRFRAATIARDRAAIALGLAPEGSAPD